MYLPKRCDFRIKQPAERFLARLVHARFARHEVHADRTNLKFHRTRFFHKLALRRPVSYTHLFLDLYGTEIALGEGVKIHLILEQWLDLDIGEVLSLIHIYTQASLLLAVTPAEEE